MANETKVGFGTPAHKAACAWDHIKQCGSTIVKRSDGNYAGYVLLKKQGKITFAGGIARLAGEALRRFNAGEEIA